MKHYLVTVHAVPDRAIPLVLRADQFDEPGRSLSQLVILQEAHRRGFRLEADEIEDVDWTRRWTRRSTPVAFASDPSARTRRGAQACGAALRVAHRILPAWLRDDQLDEWLDEIETAAAAKKPTAQRTVSILFRALPRLAITSRLPAPKRRERG